MRVYAGIDPLTKKELYLRETVPAGPGAAREAEQVRTRLLAQVDQKRNPRTRATVNQLLDRWLEVLGVETTTKRGYVSKIDKHVRPTLGDLPVAKVDVETLDAFYAQLGRCRDHCNGKQFIQHRTTATHDCDEHRGASCSPSQPALCRACKRACRHHVCKGLADSSVRQIHWILSGALSRAVRWGWTGVNPADHAEPPPLPHPDPDPPTPKDAARLLEAAWASDSDWGSYVWSSMTVGARRGEMCALHITDLEPVASVLTIRRALYADDDGPYDDLAVHGEDQRR